MPFAYNALSKGYIAAVFLEVLQGMKPLVLVFQLDHTIIPLYLVSHQHKSQPSLKPKAKHRTL